MNLLVSLLILVVVISILYWIITLIPFLVGPARNIALIILALIAVSCAHTQTTPRPGVLDETSLLRSGVVNPWIGRNCWTCGDSGRPGIELLCCDAMDELIRGAL